MSAAGNVTNPFPTGLLLKPEGTVSKPILIVNGIRVFGGKILSRLGTSILGVGGALGGFGSTCAMMRCAIKVLRATTHLSIDQARNVGVICGGMLAVINADFLSTFVEPTYATGIKIGTALVPLIAASLGATDWKGFGANSPTSNALLKGVAAGGVIVTALHLCDTNYVVSVVSGAATAYFVTKLSDNPIANPPPV